MMVNEKNSFVNNLWQISRFYPIFPQAKLTQIENICWLQNLSIILQFGLIYTTEKDNKNPLKI